ncbi:MAG: iron ABC transporter permease [Lutibacter sp.]|uniref:FecCD family ABC transporter permease n=1 Tax=Lutibacter sp. TaxID=1925666 RepID=UPI0017AF6BE5|nr:iron ABC transporter permease [Lutibacter sp.]MBT8317030.1 iron ABC transporter permease [Lutibacter sp.]NNJ57890.1 iron ABC transporter permease [Lutibacter sp.]
MVSLTKSYRNTFILLLISLLIISFINISLGSVSIPFKQLLLSLINGDVAKESWRTIVLDYRLPKAITAIIVGSGLSISGLLMQTLFRNPLAGPYVLGISSGASLGVAILILGASFLGASITSYAFTNFGLAIAASIGSFMVLSAVMIAAIKVRNTMSILIIGLMFGSLTAAIISVLAYFSSASQLQQYLFWSFGSLGNLSWNEIIALISLFSIGILLVVFIIKPLNSLLIGENYAKSMGVNVKLTRSITLISTSLLTGVITAFSGPIAFIGLAVPHLTKLLFNTSDHKILLPAVAISGSIIMLICDSIAQLPTSDYTLPINAITSLLGAPIIIWLLVRKRKIYY